METPSPKYVALWTKLTNETRLQNIKHSYRLWTICFVIIRNQHLPYPDKTCSSHILADFILQNCRLVTCISF